MMKKFLKILLISVLTIAVAFSMVACSDQPGGGNGGRKGLVGKRQDDTWVIYKYVDDEADAGVLDIGAKLDLPDGVTKVKIKANAFSDNGTLTKIIVPEAVTEIEAGAFAKMHKLKELHLPFIGQVKNADAFEFESDEAYDEDKAVDAERTIAHLFGTEVYDNGTSVTINYGSGTKNCYMPETLNKIVINASNYKIPMHAFDGLTYVENIVLSGTVTEIGQYAFANTRISSIEIPTTVSIVHEYAFNNSKVENVLFASTATDGSIEIRDGAFSGCENVNYIGAGTVTDNTIDLVKFKFTSDFGGFIATPVEIGADAFNFGNDDKKDENKVYTVLNKGSLDLNKLFGNTILA
ncbi:MAG: leucine-rich repeat protein [Clostridia bacterium]|nr:leucine-rich repeat protein [Clostridia bacterium]